MNPNDPDAVLQALPCRTYKPNATLHFPCPCSKGSHDCRNSSLFMPPYAIIVMFFKCHHSSSLVGKWKSHDRGGTGIPSQKFQRRFNSMTMIAHLNTLSVVSRPRSKQGYIHFERHADPAGQNKYESPPHQVELFPKFFRYSVIWMRVWIILQTFEILECIA